MKEYTKRPWSIRERMVLKNHYKSMSMERLVNELPGRTENSIRKQVAYLRKEVGVFRQKEIHAKS